MKLNGIEKKKKKKCIGCTYFLSSHCFYICNEGPDSLRRPTNIGLHSGRCVKDLADRGCNFTHIMVGGSNIANNVVHKPSLGGMCKAVGI